MGVSTKGVVLTACKDVFLVTKLVQRSVDRLIECERSLNFPGYAARVSAAAEEQFRTCMVTLSPDTDMVNFDFTFKGDRRTMSAFFTCDCDHRDLAPRSISLMLGCSGDSEVLMKTALHALSLLGAAYFDRNDCDETPLLPLTEFTPVVLNLVRMRIIRASDVEDLLVKFDECLTFPEAATLEGVFGAKEQWLRETASLEDFKDRWDIFRLEADRISLPALNFMTQFHQAAAAA